jgi:hypothetical protein
MKKTAASERRHAAATRVITLRFESVHEPVAGDVIDESSREFPFTGWLSLANQLRAALVNVDAKASANNRP